MDKLDQLKKKIEEVQTKSLVASEMKAFITLVISVANESKEELLKLSDDNIQTIKDSIAYIEENYSKQVDSLKNEKNSMVSDFNEKVDNLKALIKEAKNLKPLEKIIERTETIHETPIITNEIKEVAKYESPNQISDKLNTLEEVIDQKVIKGLTKKITDLSSNIAHNISKGSSTPFINGKLAKNINFTGATVSYNGDNANVSITGGSGTPAGSSGALQYNNAGSFGGFGSFNGTNALDLTGISITSAGLTTTGIFQQSGDQAVFDVAGSNFAVKTTTYTGYGLINADNTGIVSIGDFFGDGNNTYISLDDTATTLEYKATSGHAFIGQVATGAGVSSVAGSANVPLTVTETINGYVGLQVQNLSDGTTASSDFVVANDIDDGTLTTGHYLDLGIGSSTNADPLFPALNGANNGYLYIVGGNLALGTATTGKHIDFFTGGLEYTNRRLRITETGSFAFGALAPNNYVSMAPLRYSTGTASQSGTTVTGVGTTWTSAMIGNLFEFDDGTNSGIITARNSNTEIIVSVSQTVASQTYGIYYLGLEIGATGKVGINTVDPQAVLEVTNNLLGATTANNNGVVVANNTLAALGAQQISPPIRLRGSGWSTTSSASMPVDWVIEHLPVQGATAPTSFFSLKCSINGGAYTTPFQVSSAGSVSFSGALTATSLSVTQTIANSTTLANANFESFSTTAGITTAQALNGSTNTQSRTRLGGSANTVLTANNSHANVFIQGTNITEATSGTHPLLASLAVRPLNITNGTATTTATATVYIESAATGTTPAANYALMVGAGDSYFGGKIIANDVVRLKGYTVATLPAGIIGDRAYVTDATAPAYNAALTGGGAITVPVFYNGAAWVSA